MFIEWILALFGKRGTTAGRAPRNTATPEGRHEVASRGRQGTPESSEAIRQQEADGQQSLINSDTLPTQMSNHDQQILKKAGVKFGKPVQDDPLFTFVTLPAGWTKIGTDHDMWSSLLDEKGRKRASIFYKAAFYDRRAYIRTERRFGIRQDHGYEETHGAVRFHVTDCDTPVFTTEAHSFDEKYSDEYYTQSDKASDEARAWLLKHYPKCESPAMYWD